MFLSAKPGTPAAPRAGEVTYPSHVNVGGSDSLKELELCQKKNGKRTLYRHPQNPQMTLVLEDKDSNDAKGFMYCHKYIKSRV